MTKEKKLSFKLRDPEQSYVVKWPVTWKMPDDEGELVEIGFIAHFKLLPREKVEELFGSGAAAVFGLFMSPPQNRDGIRKVLVNWNGVEHEGQPGEVPFSAEALEKLIAWDDVLNAIVNAYAVCLQGRSAKN